MNKAIRDGVAENPDYAAIRLRSDFHLLAESHSSQIRPEPLQARSCLTMRSNAPESPVPGGFASSRMPGGIGLVINSATIQRVRLVSSRCETNESPSY